MAARTSIRATAVFATLVVALLVAAPVWAQRQSGLPLPRFVSIKERATEMRLRSGPSTRYPIEWVFKRPGWPIEIIGEYGTWRQVRDHEGIVGWVHSTMLWSRRTVIVAGAAQRLRNEPSELSPVLATAERGVVANLIECDGEWCRIKADNIRGWIARDSLWGIYPGEAAR